MKNKEVISEKIKDKYTCECGSCVTIHHKQRHEQTTKHQTYLNTKTIQ